MKLLITHKSIIIYFLLLLVCRNVMVAQSLSGTGSEVDPYLITNRADLEDLAHYIGSSYQGQHFRLTTDIDLADSDWTPVGGESNTNSFRGWLHGGGHSIKNLTVNSNVKSIGLFAVLDNATIDSLHIVGGSVTGGNTTEQAGALAGWIISGGTVTIRACSNSAAVITTNALGSTGGLVGYANITAGVFSMSLCSNTGNVSGGGLYTGGLIGYGRNTGAGSMTLTNSYSHAVIRATRPTSNAYVGGLAGYLSVDGAILTLSNSYAIGQVTAVTTNDNAKVGGLVGQTYASGGNIILRNSAAAQDTLTGPTGATHRILGDGPVTLIDNYAHKDMLVNGNTILTGDTDNAEGLNKTKAELNVQTTFDDDLLWNFTNTWSIRDTKSYPYLQWQSAPVAINYLYCDSVSLDMNATVDSVLIYQYTAATGATLLKKLTTVTNGSYFLNNTLKPHDTLLFIAYDAGKQPSYPVYGEVFKRAITISAQPQTITYGNDATLDFGQGSGYVITKGALSDGHTLSGLLTLNGVATSTSGHNKAGTYTCNFDNLTITNSGSIDVTDSDYNITYSNSTVTINQIELSHSVIVDSKPYDGTTAATYSGGSITTGVIAGDDVRRSNGFLLWFDDVNVGLGKPTSVQNWALAGTDEGNYKLPAWTALTADITVKTISGDDILIQAPSRTYTSASITTTVTVTDNSTETSLVENTDYTVEYSNNINAGTATVTITGAGNYDNSTTKSATFTIHPKPIQVEEWTAHNKVYDGTTAATLTFDEATFRTKLYPIDEPDITVEAPTAGTFLEVDVDYTIPVTPADVTLSGGKSANYRLIQQTGLKADITTRAFNAADIHIAPVSAYTYTGSSITPSVTVTDGAATLTEITDYIVSYRYNVNVGQATVTIRGTGNYTNDLSTAQQVSFTIHPKSIAGADIDVSNIAPQTYTGSDITPTPTVTDAVTGVLVKDTDYEVTYNDNLNVGSATVTITGKGNYTDVQYAPFDIVQKAITADDLNIAVDLGASGPRTYTGSDIEPPVVLTEGANTLTPVTDYTIIYTNNRNVGTATVTVTITGTGNYSGNASKQASFAIVQKLITSPDISVDNITPQTYTGSAIMPVLTITDAVTGILVKDTDYEVTYTDNTNAGVATVIVFGKGNYTSVRQEQFTIAQKSITIADINVTVDLGALGPRTYTGSPIEPPVVVNNGVNTLILNSDYTINYLNNVNAGMATVTITIMATGNYSCAEAKHVPFPIVPKSIADVDVTDLFSQAYTGSALEPSVVVTDGASTLILDTDYTIAYIDNVNVGTATITITGKDNYNESQQKQFIIEQKSITSPGIIIAPIPDQTYTGMLHTPPIAVIDGATTLTVNVDYTAKYTNNVNAGAATVIVFGKGNYSGDDSLSTNFVINKANQTIDVPNIPELVILAGSYSLSATATSGLPVTFTSENTEIAEVAANGVTLLLKQAGTLTIAVNQAGNENYNAAPTVSKQVILVESGNTQVVGITVNGATYDVANSRYVLNCEDNTITVIVETEDPTARVYYNNVLGHTYTSNITDLIQTVTYEVASGSNRREYTFEVAQPFKFEDIVKVRWNNTLTVINNPENNGGFHFTSFDWYGNDRPIGRKQSITAGNEGQYLSPSVRYHVVLTAEEYVGTLRSCAAYVAQMQQNYDLSAYPNPVSNNNQIIVAANVDEALLNNAEIHIFNIVGALVGKVKMQGRETPITMSFPTGIYLLNIVGKNELNETIKVIVK